MKHTIKIKINKYDACTRSWFNSKNQFHREDGPAIEFCKPTLQSKSFNHYSPYYINGEQKSWDYALIFIIPKEKNPIRSNTYNTDSWDDFL
jgi:hypothetical protein